MATTNHGNVVTPFATLSFANTLFTPRPGLNGAPAKYSCNLLFSPEAQKKDDFIAFKAKINEAFAKAFPGKKPSGPYANPFKDAETKDFDGYEPGWIFLSPKSERQPPVLNAKNQLVTDPREIYSGQIVKAYISILTYETGSNRGVTVGLNGIRVFQEGKRLGGGGVEDIMSVWGDDTLTTAMASADDMPF